MEVIRKFVDAKKLMSVISLPDTMRNRRLEVIILPADETEEIQSRKTDIERIVDSLAGCIPDNGMTLKDYRSERLEKYESID